LAKQQQETDVKKMLEKLYSVIKTTSEFSREQVKINRDLLKVMALLNDGFAKNASDANELISDITSGVEETDKFFQKWAKDRGATKKDLEEIQKKFRDIDDINDNIIEGSKDYIELLKERHDYLVDEGDLGKSLLKNHHEILNAVRSSKKEIQAMGGSLIGADEVIKKMVAKKIDFTTMFEDGFGSTEKLKGTLEKINHDIEGMVSNVSGGFFNVDLNFNPLTDDLDKEVKDVLAAIEQEKNARIDGLTEYFSKNKTLQTNLARDMAAQSKGLGIKVNIDTGELSNANGILRKGSEEYQKMVNKLDKLVSKNNLVSNLEASFGEIANLVKLGADRTDEQSKRLSELLKPMGMATQMLVEQVELKQQMLQTDVANLLAQKQTVENTGKFIGKLKSAESIVNKIGSGFDYVNSILPAGIGEFLGLSQVSMNLTEAHKKGVQSFADEMGKGVGYSKAMQGYFQAFKMPLMSALNPVTLMVAGFVLLYKFTESLVNKYKDMASEMKISLGQAQQLLDVQLDTLTSQKNQFAQLKDIQEIQTAMIGSSGKMFDLDTKQAKELSIELVEVGKYFGYGNTQAVELQKTFKRLGADDKMALNLQKNLGYMSEMAGISPQIVAQDMVDSAEMVATYFAGMPDKAAQAAIQVRRMGMSLQQAGSIANKMLDLEGFMTDMYELYAMTGQGIDFSEAFDLGLTGDIEGMTASIMKNIGTTAEFNKMDYLTRSKIAKTLGMSNDELAKSVTLNEKMGDLSKEDQKYLQGNLERIGDISALSKEDIQARLGQLQSTDRLGVAWEKIKGVLFKALIPLAEAFGEAIDAISPILDIVLLAFKGIAPIIKVIGFALKTVIQLADGFFGLFGLGSKDIERITAGIDEMGGTLGEVAKVAIALVEVFAGTAILKSFGLIKMNAWDLVKVIPNISKTIFGSNKAIQASNQETAAAVQQATQAGIDSQVKSAQAAKATLEKTASDVKVATTKMAKEVEGSVKKVKEEVSKPTKLGISTDTAKTGFKLLGDIAAKSLTAMTIHSAASFLFMRKEGEAQTSAMASNMESVMGMAVTGIAPMLIGAFQEGIERTFQKRLEKKIEGSLESPIKKASKAFGSMDTESTGVFGKIKEKAKGLFSSLGSLSKKLSGTGNLNGTFDAMASSVEKVVPKVEMVSEVVEKVKNKKVTETTSIDEPIKKLDAKKPINQTSKQVESGFGSLTNVMKMVWTGLKTVLTDIVKFVSSSMKELSSGIGTSIKNILKGIGDGLSSFKGSALKGAAAMLVISAALWVTSKAIQNFTSVKWEDIGKAGVALSGLAVVALALGSASGQMIVGAIAIALLGASLIPAAYALNMFNDVDWASLGKAGLALIGLGVAGGIIGGMLPLMLMGAVGIAALGASLIPLAFAMQMFNTVDWDSLKKAGVALIGFGIIAAGFALVAPAILTGSLIIGAASVSLMLFGGAVLGLNLAMKNLDLKPLKELTVQLMNLVSIPISQLLGLSVAITSVGASLMAFQTMTSIGNIGSGISKMFGGDAVKDLQRLADMANPLYLAANAIGDLAINITSLVESLGEVDLGELSKIQDFTIDSKVQQKIKPVVESNPVQRDNTNVKVSPVQVQIAQPQLPKQEAVAQDKRLDVKKIAEANVKLQQAGINQNQDIYNNTDMVSDFRNMELKLDKMIYLLELQVRKDLAVNMDSSKVNSVLKARNNNK
jgi:hypothetical protein